MQGSDSRSFGSDSNESDYDQKANQIRSKSLQHDNVQSSGNIPKQTNCSSSLKSVESAEVLGGDPSEMGLGPKLTDKSPTSGIQDSMISNGPVPGARRPAVWGRTPVSINFLCKIIFPTIF